MGLRPIRDHRSNVTLTHWDDLAAREKAGNSRSARTIVFNVNAGVCLFNYTTPPAGKSVKVLVTLKDDGGIDFGGNDTAEVILNFTSTGVR